MAPPRSSMPRKRTASLLLNGGRTLPQKLHTPTKTATKRDQKIIHSITSHLAMMDLLESPMTYSEIWARDEEAGKAEAGREMIYNDVSIVGIEFGKRRMNALWKNDLKGNLRILFIRL